MRKFPKFRASSAKCISVSGVRVVVQRWRFECFDCVCSLSRYYRLLIFIAFITDKTGVCFIGTQKNSFFDSFRFIDLAKSVWINYFSPDWFEFRGFSLDTGKKHSIGRFWPSSKWSWHRNRLNRISPRIHCIKNNRKNPENRWNSYLHRLCCHVVPKSP